MALIKLPFTACLVLLLWSCTAPAPPPASVPESQVKHVGAMRNVMWKGELNGSIKLDTIAARDHLFALGPVSGLRGEIMAIDGKVYVSRVSNDTSMTVDLDPEVDAPFLVFADVASWREIPLPSTVITITDLEQLLDGVTQDQPRPFAFKLEGSVNSATIHVQNLAPGSKVSSPEEAHRGQVKYPISDTDATIVGFFSTEHQGVFTHHDSYLHMHLLTEDATAMGHVDDLSIAQMKLYINK